MWPAGFRGLEAIFWSQKRLQGSQCIEHGSFMAHYAPSPQACSTVAVDCTRETLLKQSNGIGVQASRDSRLPFSLFGIGTTHAIEYHAAEKDVRAPFVRVDRWLKLAALVVKSRRISISESMVGKSPSAG